MIRLPIALVALSGCYPTLPPNLSEGTEVLRPGGVSLTFAGGAAGVDANCCAKGASSAVLEAGGIDSRVRVGIGHHQELGADLFFAIGSTVAHSDIPFGVGGALAYKIAPVPWLAIVARGGAIAYGAAAIAIGTGDIAVIVAPYTARDGSQLYMGLRGGVAIPVLDGAQNINETITAPIGYTLHASGRVRLFIEGGPVLGLAQQGTQNVTTLGAYGAAAVSFIVR